MKKVPAEEKAPPTPLAAAFKAWWEREGMRPADFARHIGIDYQLVQHVMAGTKQPRWLPQAAKKLRTTVENLLAGKVPPPRGAQLDGSVDELPTALTPAKASSLSRDDFLDACANLSTPDWQLTVRLWVAVGILPGVVEGIWQNDKDRDSGMTSPPPPTPKADIQTEEAKPAQPRRGRT